MRTATHTLVLSTIDAIRQDAALPSRVTRLLHLVVVQTLRTNPQRGLEALHDILDLARTVEHESAALVAAVVEGPPPPLTAPPPPPPTLPIHADDGAPAPKPSKKTKRDSATDQ